jgi:hypothetical protein
MFFGLPMRLAGLTWEYMAEIRQQQEANGFVGRDDVGNN